jgi:hypothetical protein
MKITKIEKVGKHKVYDITVADNHQYVLENGVVTHNTGIYYSANTIFIIGRQQEKEGTEVVGYNFIINIEKSRFVREKSKIPITVTFEGGIGTWSGLLEMALESGHVIKPSNGWYSKVDKSTGEIESKKYRAKDTDNKEFWLPILSNKSFLDWVKDRYTLATGQMLSDNAIQEELDKVDYDVEEELAKI